MSGRSKAILLCHQFLVECVKAKQTIVARPGWCVAAAWLTTAQSDRKLKLASTVNNKQRQQFIGASTICFSIYRQAVHRCRWGTVPTGSKVQYAHQSVRGEREGVAPLTKAAVPLPVSTPASNHAPHALLRGGGGGGLPPPLLAKLGTA
jgi:hypothetical protein